MAKPVSSVRLSPDISKLWRLGSCVVTFREVNADEELDTLLLLLDLLVALLLDNIVAVGATVAAATAAAFDVLLLVLLPCCRDKWWPNGTSAGRRICGRSGLNFLRYWLLLLVNDTYAPTTTVLARLLGAVMQIQR